MKILSDFDGVFTTPEGEAASCAAYLDELLGDRALLAALRAEVSSAPERHGWMVSDSGRTVISAYADEDPYIYNNGVVAALYERGPAAVLTRLRDSGFVKYSDLSIHCFEEGTRRYRAAHASHAEEAALARVAQWLSAGHEVVIVSNSSTDRIEAILRGGGFEPGQRGLRVRGNALKFRLGDQPTALPAQASFGARPIALRRPSFWKILSEELPNAFIGDVLSLDLALPAAARRTDPRFAGLRLFLRRRGYTPAWVLDACRDAAIDVVEALPELR